MVSSAYERIPGNEADVRASSYTVGNTPTSIPISPPPSFRSRASSLTARPADSHGNEVDTALVDAFGTEASDDEEAEVGDDRQRLMRSAPPTEAPRMPRRTTELPAFAPPTTTAPRTAGIPFSTFSSSNDGVFANLSAKPEKGEKVEELPPSYEAAAADATPPYWENTILAPGMLSDEVYIDGLPLGSLFSFVWNAIISMSFQLVGFLLTYLLHTTHAAKNGSRAGLGITLVHYGFLMKNSASRAHAADNVPLADPADPSSHNFDPSATDSTAAAVAGAVASSATSSAHGFATREWLAYMLMIVGWFVLIRSMTNYVKARRHQQLILQSPDRGLNVPVVMEGERSETVV